MKQKKAGRSNQAKISLNDLKTSICNKCFKILYQLFFKSSFRSKVWIQQRSIAKLQLQNLIEHIFGLAHELCPVILMF